MTKETFQEKFSENPRRDDLTLLAPKQDDPTEQVQGQCAMVCTPVVMPLQQAVYIYIYIYIAACHY